MKISIKIGTMCLDCLHVCYKRKLPEIGDRILVRNEGEKVYQAQQVDIVDIVEGSFRHGKLYFASR